MKREQIVLIIIMILAAAIYSQEPYEGYTLYGPNGSHNTYLIDMNGDNVHTWYSSNTGGYSAYLAEDGLLLRPVSVPNPYLNGGASSGRFEKLDWEGNIVWQFDYQGHTYLPHHDIEPLPNGNFLVITWEVKSGAETLANGRSSAITLWPDYIVEIEPVGTNGGNIIWEWYFWDHLIQDFDPTKLNYGVVEDHPELLDINLGGTGGGPGGGGDWLHINGIDYNAELDQITISSHNLNEIYVIDHSTTTAVAAGHTGGNSGMGGDLLYRWGKPANYGATGNYTFNTVHCAYWVPADCPGAGNIMAFNNGSDNHQSKVVEIEPPYENTYNYSWTPGTSFAPSLPVWQYTNGTSFYSNHLGSVQRFPNGNTLICESTSGDMFEVDENGSVLWEKNTTYEIARCLRYAPDYPGLNELFPHGYVNGTVVDENTLVPIEGAVVIIGVNEIETNAVGYYEIELAAGTYQMSCEHPDYEIYTYPDDIVLNSDQTITINVSMNPLAVTGTVAGSVNDVTTLAPIENAIIVLGEYETVSDENGTFLIELPVGEYNLVCSREGYETYINPETVTVIEDQVQEIEILLTPVAGSAGELEEISPKLYGNYPNPFNPETTISFFTAESTENTELIVYNLKGQKVKTLLSEHLAGGKHSVTWDGRDDNDIPVASGMYLYKLIYGNQSTMRKMILMK